MNWSLLAFIIYILLYSCSARDRDEDAELSESFYRLLNYDDDFKEFIRSQRDEQYDFDRNSLGRYDDDKPNRRFSEQLLDTMNFYRHKKKKDSFERLFRDEQKRAKQKDDTDRKAALLTSNEHNNVESLLRKDSIPGEQFHNANVETKKRLQDVHKSDTIMESRKANGDQFVPQKEKMLDGRNNDNNEMKPSKEDENVGGHSVVADPVSAESSDLQTTQATTTLPKTQVISTKKDTSELNDMFFVVIVVACSLACIAGLTLAAYCWYRLRREAKEAEATETAPFTGGTKSDTKLKKSDEKLAKSAEMYHYVHSKNQLTAMHGKDPSKGPTEADDSSSSEDEGDNTIYECSGLAPPGDMKVVNPLFADEGRQSDAKSEGSVSPIRDIQPSPPVAKIDPPTGTEK